ncbi:TM2 domain-containing protein [Saccharibacter floricola]|uniref:TM2 domain-containing protein n=1 Tax=Saccharibacter floricola DSM 15669 TaxID=1123227 RepID=A0ABQ0NYL2_9PROT|nr:TM2 domain-containing protein [Saccharibacter floricola]GBQ06464.1 TM2 domain-containing protein [Saccharibacter floricola DSM 15669]
MKQKIYLLELQSIIHSVSENDRERYVNLLVERIRNPVVTFGLSAFLGSWGVDRFYMGDVGLGIVKLLTLGGFGIWTLIDLFFVAGTTREKNIQLARELKASLM